MDFDKKLENAIERGQQRNTRLKDAERQKTLSAEDLRNRHNEYRLDLSEYIEINLKKMAQHFPGFERGTDRQTAERIQRRQYRGQRHDSRQRVVRMEPLRGSDGRFV